ncbi:hypothetical protein ACFPRL_07945 [Pseudoclavibacter helvolus]
MSGGVSAIGNLVGVELACACHGVGEAEQLDGAACRFRRHVEHELVRVERLEPE